jgi:sulfide dehydrogenase cytochrome subunit
MWNRAFPAVVLLLIGCLSGLVSCVGRPAPPEPVVPQSESKAKTELMNGASAELLASNCFGCHGFQGHSTAPPIPSLAGLSESYFIDVMHAYQYGGRYGTVMGRIALAYDDAEIRRMAAYFMAQLPRQQRRTNDSSLSLGASRLHRHFCGDCHGDLNSSAKPDAVTLHGQWQSYLRWTLQDYLVGINQAREGMSEALSNLIRQQGQEGVEQLIQYYGRNP